MFTGSVVCRGEGGTCVYVGGGGGEAGVIGRGRVEGGLMANIFRLMKVWLAIDDTGAFYAWPPRDGCAEPRKTQL